MSDNSTTGFMDAIRRQGEKRRAEERERKATLAKEMTRVGALPFRARILEAYKLHYGGLMTSTEFTHHVVMNCHRTLDYPPEE